MTEKRPTKAVVYCRISDDRTGEGAGVERQEADCRKLAESLGWTVADVFVDNSVSAYSGKRRPAYEAMVRALERDDITGLLAWHPDRLTRRLADLEALVEVIERTGVEVRTVTAGQVDLTTADGRFMAGFIGLAAKRESEHRGERVKAAARQRALSGKPHGGSRPFGYLKGGTVPDPTESVVVVEVFERFVVGGESLRALTFDLNRRGITTTTGRTWTGPGVRAILRNPRYAGLVPHKGEPIGEAQWPALISRGTWEAARAILDDPARRTTTGNAVQWLGSGLYICGPCGQPTLRVSTSGTKTPAYRCASRAVVEGGGHVVRAAAALDEYVTAALIARLERPDVVEALRPREGDTDNRALVTEQAALRARADDAARLFAAGTISAAQLARITQDIAQREGEVTAQIAARTGSPVAAVAGPGLRERWPSLPLDTRRAVLDTLAVVTVLPSSGRGRAPFDPSAISIDWR